MALIIELSTGDLLTRSSEDGTVTLGRDPTATVTLPGLHVARRHAELVPGEGGRFTLQCRTPLGVRVNSRVITDAVELNVGDRIAIGPHSLRLTVDADSGAPLLEVRVAPEEEGDRAGASGALDLRGAGLRMRRPAVLSAAAVLLLLLVVPLLLRALAVPGTVEAVLPSDTLWSSGRISNAHQHFAQDCAACHEKLFVRVRDQACLDCHAGVGDHTSHPQLMKVTGLDEQRCASCHREHGGTHAVLPEHPKICVDCHGRPERFADHVALAHVADFGGAHPEFRATVTRRDEGGVPSSERVSLAEMPGDETGLIFPHDLHLAPEGVRGADDVVVMTCRDCHQPDAGRVGFRSIRFERHCQDCHQLDVGIGEEVLRLPHADSALVHRLVVDAVEALPDTAFDAAPQRGMRRRPGPAAARGDAPSADELVSEVFSTRVCAKCHLVADAEPHPEVADVTLRDSWFVHARFSHAAHGWVPCSDCHAAGQSADADDLLLPGIATCRDCHTGVASRRGIQSTCIDCHGFHQAGGATMESLKGELHLGIRLPTAD